KKFLAFAAVAGMAALVSCGGAEEAAKKLQDSINMADSMARVQHTADSTHMADSIKTATEAAAAKAKADSMAMAAHQDSVDKKLIKTTPPKKGK
ncbi:MAG TPA: hypothetical protein VFJ43_01735, partial [Bacteroidia bacterium]|nr:hypothetical protein [Bacteroidia bacterium]